MSHSDFWQILEEKLSLIEFEKMTADTLATNIFLEKANSTTKKLASEILYETNDKGDAAKLRNEIFKSN